MKPKRSWHFSSLTGAMELISGRRSVLLWHRGKKRCTGVNLFERVNFSLPAGAAIRKKQLDERGRGSEKKIRL